MFKTCLKVICYGVSAVFLGLTSGCGQGNERLSEKATIEGQAQIQAQNDMQARKAKEMEDDLSDRQRFYQASRGVYEGNMLAEQGEVRVKIQLVPSLPPYSARRVRQLEEISYDLNNLYFNAQVILWNPANPLSAVGCRVEQIRPDLQNGQINIASSACPNVYILRISGAAAASSGNALGEVSSSSSALAASIRNGSVTKVTTLEGEIYPTTNAAVYRLIANRQP